MFFRTDLALEEQEAAGACLAPEHLRVHQQGDCRITRMALRGDDAQRFHKPEGKYVTIELPPISDHIDGDNQYLQTVADELRRLLPQEGLVLVAGLGNRAITPDALGPKTIEQVLATRHITKELKRITGVDSLRPVAAVSPNVLGNTGMETFEVLHSLVQEMKPAAVIAIDALAARSLNRLGCTVQLSDAGIAPGAGVGNHRPQIDRNSLGAPVIALGVPTVVDAGTLASDLLTQGSEEHHPHPECLQALTAPRGAEMVVTPREIDLLIIRAARLAAMAINTALNPCFSVSEFSALVAG